MCVRILAFVSSNKSIANQSYNERCNSLLVRRSLLRIRVCFSFVYKYKVLVIVLLGINKWRKEPPTNNEVVVRI